MNHIPVLYNTKKDCCGCGTCSIMCPRKAIIMEKDEFGFVYPRIQEENCISCGLCTEICAFQHRKEGTAPQAVYALSRKNQKRLLNSASGGVFAAIAEQWISEGGIVFGAALLSLDGHLSPHHASAQTADELALLLGSKYVQSNLGNIFFEVKNQLDTGRKVLFSGTPCQIDALNIYLKKSYANLLTMDLICHGVPSAAMFADYLNLESKKIGAPIADFKFRDKANGWGLNARIIYTKNSKSVSKFVSSNESSFYELFLRSEIYRENCYHCPYTNFSRPADLTIGDYWGIELEHPEYLVPNGYLDPKSGISVLMIHTKKGMDAFDRYKREFICYPSTFEKAARHNEQLNHPSLPGPNREKILCRYQKKGYSAVDAWFWWEKRKHQLVEQAKGYLHYKISLPIKTTIKKVLRRI